MHGDAIPETYGEGGGRPIAERASRIHNIAVLNRSTVLKDSTLAEICAALEKQVMSHFAPLWGIGSHIRFVQRSDLTSWRGCWNIVVADTSDEAGALGYHSLSPEGLPVGFAFAKTTQLYGGEISVTISHEVLEQLLDPYINLCAEDSARGVFVALEASDAVEDDSLAYKVDDVLVSDFVLPAFFDPTAASRKDVRYSYRGNVHAPFALAQGGYEAMYVPGKGWTQNTARIGPPKTSDLPFIGSRRERRMRGMENWQRSPE